MSRTLSLIEAGWESVRISARHGRWADALTRATRFLARPDLPGSLAAEGRRQTGELALDSQRYPEARRHLRAAAALEPSCAKTYYLWGLALQFDPDGCDRRAALRFRRASRLEPGNHLYQAAFGRAAVRCGRPFTGVRALLAAAGAAPGEVTVVRVVVEGLLEAGRVRTARRVLTRARFLCPADRTLAALWERVRFESARREQCGEHARGERGGTTRHGQHADIARDGGRVVLPFVRMADDGGSRVSDGAVRRDVVSFPRPHFPRLMAARKADR